MNNSIPLRAAPQVSVTGVIILRCKDKVKFDRAALARAFADRSLPEAEDMLCRILESIAYWLDILQQSDADLHASVKAARRIALVAGQVGLTGLRDAAGHVGDCLTSSDAVALAATVGRLERAFDLAVSEVWHFRET